MGYHTPEDSVRQNICGGCGQHQRDCICCRECDGSGWVPTNPMDGVEHYGLDSDMTKICPKCGGDGK